MNDFIKNINDVFQKVFEWVLALLPTSPFSKLELPERVQAKICAARQNVT